MTRDANDPMEAEFDTVAEWTAQVAADLGPEYFVPAACRGSGQPVALDWLLTGLRAGPGDLLLDVGAGIGGPAAYAIDRLLDAGATVFGPKDVSVRGGAVSFWYKDIHPHDLAQVLDTEGVCIRAGHHCAQPLMRWCGVVGTARASFSVYSSPEDVSLLSHAVGALRSQL